MGDALAVADLVMVEAVPAIAEGDTAVPVQCLGPPEVEARRDALLRQMLASPTIRIRIRDTIIAGRRLRGRDLYARAHADLCAGPPSGLPGMLLNKPLLASTAKGVPWMSAGVASSCKISTLVVKPANSPSLTNV